MNFFEKVQAVVLFLSIAIGGALIILIVFALINYCCSKII